VELESSILTLISNRRIINRPDLLRGFFGSKYQKFKLLHQHGEEGLIYHYPLVRYAVLDGAAVIIGYLEGSRVLQEIYSSINNLNIGGADYPVFEKTLEYDVIEFGLGLKYIKYYFINPWLALNQKNYLKYMSLGLEDRRKFLCSILIGNILSASKGLGYKVPEHIDVDLRRTRTVKCRLKGVPVIGFKTEFYTRFILPELFGLGKSVSRGFGLIRRSKEGL